MSISYEADGSVLLRSDHESPRTYTIAAGTSRSEQEVIIVAFFAADGSDDRITAPLEAIGGS